LIKLQTFYRDKQAAAAVEFAIVGPLFIFLLLAMIAYAIYFGAVHSVQQIAADAARASIAGLSESERKSLAQGFIDVNASHYVLLNPELLTVNVADSTADGTQFIVSVQYDARQLPIWNLYLPLPLPDFTISRNSTIRVGGI
jgi:Flp pilus assembly protein TadG